MEQYLRDKLSKKRHTVKDILKYTENNCEQGNGMANTEAHPDAQAPAIPLINNKPSYSETSIKTNNYMNRQ